MTVNHNQPAALAILLLILLAILGLLATSCTHTRYIESVRIETRFDSVYFTDSIYISDSVRIEIRGDSCFTDHSHFEKETTERGALRVDTIFHTDSIYVYRDRAQAALSGLAAVSAEHVVGLGGFAIIAIFAFGYFLHRKRTTS